MDKEKLLNIIKTTIAPGDKTTFITPDIPQKKLSNSIKSFGAGMTKKSILCLVDGTVFGSAKQGLLISMDGISWKSTNGGPQSIKYEQIKNVEARRVVSGIVINGRKKIDLTQTNKSTVSGIQLFILKIIEQDGQQDISKVESYYTPNRPRQTELEESIIEQRQVEKLVSEKGLFGAAKEDSVKKELAKNAKKIKRKLSFSERSYPMQLNEETVTRLVADTENYFTSRKYVTFVAKENNSREVWAKGLMSSTPYAVIFTIEGQKLKLSFGRTSVAKTMGVTAAGAAVLTGGVGLIGGAAVAAKRTNMEKEFWPYIEAKIESVRQSLVVEGASSHKIINNVPKESAQDIIEVIEKLAAIHEKGILTDEEFEAKKTELLSRL
jgi:hypothetical protein